MARKSEIITLKVDADLLETMKGIPNRSDFIRAAILAALDNICPVCAGTGILSPKQQEHWQQFTSDHAVEECGECHEVHLVCSKDGKQEK